MAEVAALVDVGSDVGVDGFSSLCGHGEGVAGFAVVARRGYFLLLPLGCHHFVDLVVVVVGWGWEVALVLLVVGAF